MSYIPPEFEHEPSQIPKLLKREKEKNQALKNEIRVLQDNFAAANQTIQDQKNLGKRFTRNKIDLNGFVPEEMQEKYQDMMKLARVLNTPDLKSLKETVEVHDQSVKGSYDFNLITQSDYDDVKDRKNAYKDAWKEIKIEADESEKQIKALQMEKKLQSKRIRELQESVIAKGQQLK